MKREGLEIEGRIAEALRAATGGAGRAPARQAESALGLSGKAPEAVGAAGWALSDLVSRLEGLAKPVAAGSESGWGGLVSSLNPILGGLLRLFGRGEEDAPAQLRAVVRPTTMRYDMGFGGDSGYNFVDRDAAGVVRAAGPSGPPAVVVHVEAIDSRSFLERTPEIAEAFKRALLESEGIQGLMTNWRE